MSSTEFNKKLNFSWITIKNKIKTDNTFRDAGKAKIKAYENFWFFIDINEIPGMEIHIEEKIKIDYKKISESKTWSVNLEDNIFRIELKKKNYKDFFEKIINLILTKIYLNNFKKKNAINCFLESLIEAKNFFEDDNKLHTLTKQSEIGLIGELILLKDFYLKKCDPKKAVQYWTGPYKKHDFETEFSLLETKTTTLKNSRIVRTSSSDQLSPIFEKKLYLAFVQISEHTTGKNLNDFVQEIFNILKPISEILLNEFILKVTKSGYHERHVDNYKVKYSKKNIEYYFIKEDFPYLKYISAPPEISELDINYNLDLDRCNRFIIKEEEIKY